MRRPGFGKHDGVPLVWRAAGTAHRAYPPADALHALQTGEEPRLDLLSLVLWSRLSEGVQAKLQGYLIHRPVFEPCVPTAIARALHALLPLVSPPGSTTLEDRRLEAPVQQMPLGRPPRVLALLPLVREIPSAAPLGNGLAPVLPGTPVLRQEGDDRGAPGTPVIARERKAGDARVARQKRMDHVAQNAFPLPVNDPYFQDSAIAAL